MEQLKGNGLDVQKDGLRESSAMVFYIPTEGVSAASRKVLTSEGALVVASLNEVDKSIRGSKSWQWGRLAKNVGPCWVPDEVVVSWPITRASSQSSSS